MTNEGVSCATYPLVLPYLQPFIYLALPPSSMLDTS